MNVRKWWRNENRNKFTWWQWESEYKEVVCICWKDCHVYSVIREWVVDEGRMNVRKWRNWEEGQAYIMTAKVANKRTEGWRGVGGRIEWQKRRQRNMYEVDDRTKEQKWDRITKNEGKLEYVYWAVEQKNKKSKGDIKRTILYFFSNSTTPQLTN